MRISYNKLWKLLIDKEMTKMQLKDAAGISAASIAKLGKGGNITTDVLLKICEMNQSHNRTLHLLMDLLLTLFQEIIF